MTRRVLITRHVKRKCRWVLSYFGSKLWIHCYWKCKCESAYRSFGSCLSFLQSVFMTNFRLIIMTNLSRLFLVFRLLLLLCLLFPVKLLLMMIALPSIGWVAPPPLLSCNDHPVLFCQVLFIVMLIHSWLLLMGDEREEHFHENSNSLPNEHLVILFLDLQCHYLSFLFKDVFLDSLSVLLTMTDSSSKWGF